MKDVFRLYESKKNDIENARKRIGESFYFANSIYQIQDNIKSNEYFVLEDVDDSKYPYITKKFGYKLMFEVVNG